MKTFLRIVMATTGVAVGLSSFAAQTTKSSPAAKPKANARKTKSECAFCELQHGIHFIQ